MNGVEDLSTEKLLDLYKRLVLLRRFEERVYYLFLQGKIPGRSTSTRGRRQWPWASATASATRTG